MYVRLSVIPEACCLQTSKQQHHLLPRLSIILQLGVSQSPPPSSLRQSGGTFFPLRTGIQKANRRKAVKVLDQLEGCELPHPRSVWQTASPESEQALLSSWVRNEREVRLMDNAGCSPPASTPGVLAVAPRRQICAGSERCNDGNGRREALKPAAFETVGIGSSESSAKGL